MIGFFRGTISLTPKGADDEQEALRKFALAIQLPLAVKDIRRKLRNPLALSDTTKNARMDTTGFLQEEAKAEHPSSNIAK